MNACIYMCVYFFPFSHFVAIQYKRLNKAQFFFQNLQTSWSLRSFDQHAPGYCSFTLDMLQGGWKLNRSPISHCWYRKCNRKAFFGAKKWRMQKDSFFSPPGRKQNYGFKERTKLDLLFSGTRKLVGKIAKNWLLLPPSFHPLCFACYGYIALHIGGAGGSVNLSGSFAL